jgi:hypothetical protein
MDRLLAVLNSDSSMLATAVRMCGRITPMLAVGIPPMVLVYLHVAPQPPVNRRVRHAAFLSLL